MPVLDLVVRPKQPEYADILERDAAIRDFELPPALRIADGDGVQPSHPIGMQQVWSTFTVELGMSYESLQHEKTDHSIGL